MKRTIITLAAILMTGCVNNAPKYRAEIDAHNAEYERASQALTAEFDARRAAATPEELPAVHDWYQTQITTLIETHLDRIDDTFDRWRQDASGN